MDAKLKKSKIPSDPKKKNLYTVGIGASAGGLDALKQLMSQLPLDTGMIFVIIQHLDPTRDSATTEIISKCTQMPVKEVKRGMKAVPNCVYMMPSKFQMGISKGRFTLISRSDVKHEHFPINFFFRSLAKEKKSRAIGVILSGTAQDGTDGMRAIKGKNGITFVQDPKSARFDGMPSSAIEAEVVDLVMPPQAIAEALGRLAQEPRLSVEELAKAIHQGHDHNEEEFPPSEALQKIFSLLREHMLVDFSGYKMTTIQRRIQRRMTVNKIQNIEKYAHFLQGNTEEIQVLCADIFIHVTEFFRDPGSFEALKERVFPMLLRDRTIDSSIRIWVPGCATGEEPYSIAIAMLEFLGDRASRVPLQIFATDISEQAVQRARSGVYTESQLQNVSKERLERFFDPVKDGYKIKKMVRDLCIFSKHDVISNPPFAKIDLISFRNVLIYFAPILQKKVIPVFHYALNPGGFLLVGRSETTSDYSRIFSVVDNTNKIYVKVNTATPMTFQFPSGIQVGEKLEIRRGNHSGVGLDIQKDFDRIVMSKYAPAGVVINSGFEILQIRGQIGPFLELRPGHPNYHLFKMVRHELLASLRVLVQSAKKQNTSVRKDKLSFKHDEQKKLVNLEVVPMNPLVPIKERQYAVLFEDVSAADRSKSKTKVPPATKRLSGQKLAKFQNQYIAQLQQELESIKEHQQSFAEDYDSAQEELTSVNEELQSTNEELQSTNEELETAKEELQAANEELTTTNDELNNRNISLNSLNTELARESAHVQLFEAVVVAANEAATVEEAAQIFLDRTCNHTGWSVGHAYLLSDDGDFQSLNAWYNDDERRHGPFREATTRANFSSEGSLFNRTVSSGKPVLITNLDEKPVIPRAEIAKRVGLRSAFAFPVFVGEKVEAVFEFFSTQTMKPDNRFLEVMAHMAPQLGRVIERKRAIESRQREENQKTSIVTAALDCIISMDHHGNITEFNPAAEATFGYKRDEVMGKEMAEVIIPKRLREPHRQGLKRYLTSGYGPVMDKRIELTGLRSNGDEFPVELTITRLPGEPPIFVGFIRDITDLKKADESIRARTKELQKANDALKIIETNLRTAVVIRDNFLSIASHELKTPVTALRLYLQLINQQFNPEFRKNPPSPEMLTKSLLSALKQIDRLTLLVEDLLDVSKVQAGKLSLVFEKINLSEVVKDITERFASQLQEADCPLKLELDKEIDGIWDRLRIEQIVTNLLSNAIKYAPGKPIRVTAHADHHRKFVTLSVQDFGPGIPKAEHDLVFERFGRATSSKNIGGLGLGLFIVKEIVEAMRGSIILESEPNEGSRFVIHLPIQHEENPS